MYFYLDLKRNNVLHKKVCCVSKKNVTHQNYVSHKKLFCGNKKKLCKTQKRGSCRQNIKILPPVYKCMLY